MRSLRLCSTLGSLVCFFIACYACVRLNFKYARGISSLALLTRNLAVSHSSLPWKVPPWTAARSPRRPSSACGWPMHCQ